MKILYHHRTQAEDAQGIHIHEMVTAFRALGHEVELAALVELDATRQKKIRGNRWKWLVRWAPNWLYEALGVIYNLYGYRRLCRAIGRHRPDLIYERYALNTFCGVWASRRFGIPLVLEVNAPLYQEQRGLGRLAFERLARWSERWICSHSTWTIVVTKAMKDLLQREGVPGQKMVVMANGIDPQIFHPGVSRQPVRQRYGFGQELVAGFIGWFRPWHGLELLLEVMHTAGLFKQGVRLLLVGDGPAQPALRRYAEEHALLSSVIFTGPVHHREIPAHIAAMDIAVQPSAPEYACPMKIIEYMAMAKCIVAPDQPNIRELLDDRKTGLLFQPGKRENLASILCELAHDQRLRDAAGREARSAVLERGLYWRANAQRTLSLVFGNQVPTSDLKGHGERVESGTVRSPITNGFPRGVLRRKQ
jgi:glycosyltransferase involved in cell wall biosynthesis